MSLIAHIPRNYFFLTSEVDSDFTKRLTFNNVDGTLFRFDKLTSPVVEFRQFHNDTPFGVKPLVVSTDDPRFCNITLLASEWPKVIRSQRILFDCMDGGTVVFSGGISIFV